MVARQKDVSKEALSRLPNLDIYELREEWGRLYKADASPNLSRELLIRAVAYRMQEVALGGLRPEPLRQLRQIAQELKQTGEAKRFRPQLKPGTRLMREWQGRTYEGVVLDGGFSGGNIERPALQRLLADIRGGRIDIIVVYKVDRLTRSLADFARLVEIFDAQGVSFVSVTQQFNTTSSMGRLTLNVLLSFAQFEREVTGERIRDKIAASKKKGMWMGGIVPLGYDASERTLVVNAAEADTVRCIFALYRELGCVRRVKEEADRLGLSTKRSTTAGGIERGGRPFSRGHIYNLLSNPIYIGEIAHKDQLYPGQHPALIDAYTWAAVRDQLAANARDHRRKAHATEPSLLAGLLTDAQGERLTPSHAVKKGRRYRYYVSAALITEAGTDRAQGWRLAAREIEEAVIRILVDALTNPASLVEPFGG